MKKGIYVSTVEQTVRYLKVSHLSMNKQAEKKQSLEGWNESIATSSPLRSAVLSG